MFDKIKEYLRIDGNYEDATLTVLMNAAEKYILDSLNKTDKRIIKDERFELCMLLLVGHFYENREATSTKALRNLPHGVFALMNQLDFAEIDEIETVDINGTLYEIQERGTDFIVFMEAQDFGSPTFIKIDNVDYKFEQMDGNKLHFSSLRTFIFSPGELFRQGFMDLPKLFLTDVSNLAGKHTFIGDVRMDISSVDETTHSVLLVEHQQEPNETLIVFDVSTGQEKQQVEVYVDGSTVSGYALQDNEYYKLEWATIPGNIFIKGTGNSLVSYVEPVFEVLNMFTIFDTHLIKKGLETTPGTFNYEGFTYDYTDGVPYIDHTRFEYTKHEIVPPVDQTVSYDLFAVKYIQGDWGMDKHLVLIGSGTGLMSNNTISQHTFDGGIVNMVPAFYEASEGVVARISNVYYKGDFTLKEVVLEPYSVSYDVLEDKKYLPVLSIHNSSGTLLPFTSSDEYVFNTMLNCLIYETPPAWTGSSIRDLRYNTSVLKWVRRDTTDTKYVQLGYNTSQIDNQQLHFYDADNNRIGSAVGTLSGNTVQLNTDYWMPHNAVYAKFAKSGARKVINNYDFGTNIVELGVNG